MHRTQTHRLLFQMRCQNNMDITLLYAYISHVAGKTMLWIPVLLKTLEHSDTLVHTIYFYKILKIPASIMYYDMSFVKIKKGFVFAKVRVSMVTRCCHTCCGSHDIRGSGLTGGVVAQHCKLVNTVFGLNEIQEDREF